MISTIAKSFFAMRCNTLIIASRVDPASTNIANSLLRREDLWQPILSDRIYQSFSSVSGGDVYMWVQDRPLLELNMADELFHHELTCLGKAVNPINDVVFVSKHAAASGTASLTVHPIGISWETDTTRSGGIAGRCSPPSFRISSFYRSLLQEVKEFGIDKKYEVTLEATHHGPYVGLPTCFVEIGSTENEWSQEDAGELWASLLVKHFGLISNHDFTSTLRDISESNEEKDIQSSQTPSISALNCFSLPKGLVVMSIGGGHYVPKMNDMCRYGDLIYAGHALASYTLQPYFDGSVEKPVEGGWQHVIGEAVASTRSTYPDMSIVCLVDKKAFKSEFKNLILSYLTELGLKWTHKAADVKEMMLAL